jgi:hypothetical protein
VGHRGRPSTAALALVATGRQAHERPEPPPELKGKAAQAEWRGIVGRMPADWFPRETHAMLIQLCRAKVRADDIDKRIRKRGLPFYDWQQLLKAEQNTAASIARLSTKMRISQQSSYDERKKRDGGSKRPLWED